MTLPLHLVPTLAGVRVGDSVTVEGDEAHHAVAVRRLRVGESVVLTDGAGASRPARSPAPASGSSPSRRPASSPTPNRSRRSRSCRRCRRVTAASSPSSCSPRSAWRGSCRGRLSARSRCGRASGSPRGWPAGAPPRARRPSSRGAPGTPRSPSWPAPTTWSGWCARRPLPSYSMRRRVTQLAALEVPASGRLVVVVGPEGGLTDGRDRAVHGGRGALGPPRCRGAAHVHGGPRCGQCLAEPHRALAVAVTPYADGRAGDQERRTSVRPRAQPPRPSQRARPGPVPGDLRSSSRRGGGRCPRAGGDRAGIGVLLGCRPRRGLRPGVPRGALRHAARPDPTARCR